PSRPRLPGPGDREGERGVLVLDRFPCGVRPADRLVERRTRAAEPLKEVDVSRAYAEAHGVVSSPRRRGEGLRHREELGWQLRISIGYTAPSVRTPRHNLTPLWRKKNARHPPKKSPARR